MAPDSGSYFQPEILLQWKYQHRQSHRTKHRGVCFWFVTVGCSVKASVSNTTWGLVWSTTFFFLYTRSKLCFKFIKCNPDWSTESSITHSGSTGKRLMACWSIERAVSALYKQTGWLSHVKIMSEATGWWGSWGLCLVSVTESLPPREENTDITQNKEDRLMWVGGSFTLATSENY